jgi:DNA-binding NarL/FixJ family response regulator
LIGVLLVDDHAVVRAGYRRYLEQSADIRLVAEAASAEEGYAAYCRTSPHVSVVDLSMPGASGIQLMSRIIARDPNAGVIAFSMHDERLFVTQALAAGARAYVTKNSAGETLVEAVREIHAGRSFLSPDIRELMASARPRMPGPDSLSPREFEVFRLLAQGHSVTKIAEGLNLSQKTVANHQTQIKEKLGVTTTAALVHLALGSGLIKPPAPE